MIDRALHTCYTFLRANLYLGPRQTIPSVLKDPLSALKKLSIRLKNWIQEEEFLSLNWCSP